LNNWIPVKHKGIKQGNVGRYMANYITHCKKAFVRRNAHKIHGWF